MGSFSAWHWLIVLAIVLLLFGRGKIPALMGDMAEGIKSFKKGISDEEGVLDRSEGADPKKLPVC
jgi:sec-independent protein translocase protein TatA